MTERDFQILLAAVRSPCGTQTDINHAVAQALQALWERSREPLPREIQAAAQGD